MLPLLLLLLLYRRTRAAPLRCVRRLLESFAFGFESPPLSHCTLHSLRRRAMTRKPCWKVLPLP